MVLSLRVEAGLGFNICTSHGDYDCGNAGQDTAAYGRFGVTGRALHLADWIGLGLIMDIGGYAPDEPFGLDVSSVTFHMAMMVRGFVPLPWDGVELTAGIGLGLAHWARHSSNNNIDTSVTWTGMTIPITVGMGYEVYPGLVVGGDFSFYPRIAGEACLDSEQLGVTMSSCGDPGDLPFTTQLGVYVAYTFPIDLEAAGD